MLADPDAQLVEAVGHDEAHGGEVVGRAEAADGEVALRGCGISVAFFPFGWTFLVFGGERGGGGKGNGWWVV